MTESNVEMIEVNKVKDFSEDNFTKINKDIEALKIDDDIRALQELNDKVVALESYKQRLLQTKACCQEDVINVMALGISQESLPLFNSFTRNKSPNNFNKLMSTLTGFIGTAIKKIAEILMKLLDKAVAFFSISFDKQNALAKNLVQLRREADKANNGMTKLMVSKPVFSNLAGLHPVDLDTVKKRVQLHLDGMGITNYPVQDIARKSLITVYGELIDVVIAEKGNALINDAMSTKLKTSMLKEFTNIDLTKLITEFNTFINSEEPDEPLTRQYNTELDVATFGRFSSMPNKVLLEECVEIDKMFYTKTPLPQNVVSASYKDKTSLSFIDSFSQDIFKRTYTKKTLEEANTLLRSKFHPQTGWHASEMDPEYHATIMGFRSSLISFIELTKLVEKYNDSLITVVVNVARTIAFEIDLANYLNSKY